MEKKLQELQEYSKQVHTTLGTMWIKFYDYADARETAIALGGKLYLLRKKGSSMFDVVKEVETICDLDKIGEYQNKTNTKVFTQQDATSANLFDEIIRDSFQHDIDVYDFEDANEYWKFFRKLIDASFDMFPDQLLVVDTYKMEYEIVNQYPIYWVEDEYEYQVGLLI